MDKPFPNATYPVLCALIGKSPSRLSQAMHNAAFKERGLPYSYISIDTSDTDAAIESMKKLGIRGYSATIPHKERALELVDIAEDPAQEIGAINTIINDGNNLTGYNTDCDGIRMALEEAGINCSAINALIIGAGGAARAAVWTLKQLGAEVSVANRTKEKADKLASDFDVKITKLEELCNYQLVINATPIGSSLVGNGTETPFTTDQLSAEQAVFDMVTRDTPLLEQARAKNCTTVSGVRMLLFQAVRQFELFTGSKDAPVEVMQKALTSELAKY